MNSSLICYTKISPNKNVGRVHNTYNPKGIIDKITIHHMACNGAIETIGNAFANPTRQGSSNYGIGTDGRIALYVDEKDRAWTSSNPANDYHAITIEVANDGGAPDWHVSDKALNTLITLCVDICKRNGIQKINFTGNANGNLTMHKYFIATTCPGPYLGGKFPYIAEQVNKQLIVSPTNSADYIVKANDSFWKIAQSVLGDGNRYKEILQINGFSENHVIHPGDVIKIPVKDTTTDYSAIIAEKDKIIASKDKEIDALKFQLSAITKDRDNYCAQCNELRAKINKVKTALE